jgi:hypothetical protein
MGSLLPGADVAAEWGSVLPPGLPLSSFSPGYENSRAVFAGQGRLYGFAGYSSNGAGQYILCFDIDRAPKAGDIPALPPISLTAAANFFVYFGSSGRWFQRGCWLANSTTATSLTAGAADTWFDAQYVPILGSPLSA